MQRTQSSPSAFPLSSATRRRSMLREAISHRAVHTQWPLDKTPSVPAHAAALPRTRLDDTASEGAPGLVGGHDASGPAEFSGEPVLGPQQRYLLQLVRRGCNVFFTGPAGSGKSFALRKMIDELRSIHGYEEVAITATTGSAACQIGGTTFHSFLGIGLGHGSPAELAEKMVRQPWRLQRLRSTKALIVDEGSYLSAGLLDRVDSALQQIRQCTLPFGGLQVVCTADFFQLPPVSRGHRDVRLAFQSMVWRRLFPQHSYRLTTVYRQQEAEFIALLEEIRQGTVTEHSTRLVRALRREVHYPDGLPPPQLFNLRHHVKKANDAALATLPSTVRVYIAEDVVFSRPKAAHELLDGLVVPPRLELKKGAVVMLLHNCTEEYGLGNGSIGRVVGFGNEAGLTIASSTLVRPRATIQYPRVEFHLPLGGKRTIIVPPRTWRLDDGRVQLAIRTQVPLTLGYAMSTHKAQGLTMDRAVVDLKGAWECGQVYVAMSRVRDRQHLQVLNFDAGRVKVHPKAQAWYRSIPECPEEKDAAC